MGRGPGARSRLHLLGEGVQLMENLWVDGLISLIGSLDGFHINLCQSLNPIKISKKWNKIIHLYKLTIRKIKQHFRKKVLFAKLLKS